MTTSILNIPEVADGQINQYLTYNQALRDLEASINDFYTVDLSAGNVTLTNATPDFIFSRYAVFKSSGNSVARILTVPQSKRLFIVNNGGTADLTVKRGSVEIVIEPGGASLFYCDGTTNGMIGIAGGGGGGGASNVVDTVAISSGVLNLSALTGESAAVTLNENITSITYPAGAGGERKDLIVRFVQDGTGGRTVDLSGITWDGDGSPPAIASAAGDVSYITATNFDNAGWEGFK